MRILPTCILLALCAVACVAMESPDPSTWHFEWFSAVQGLPLLPTSLTAALPLYSRDGLGDLYFLWGAVGLVVPVACLRELHSHTQPCAAALTARVCNVCHTVVVAVWRVSALVSHSSRRRVQVSSLVTSFSGTTSFSTAGGDVVQLSGVGLGTATDVIRVFYRNSALTEYAATGCSVLTAGSRLQCSSVPGVGTGLQWVVEVNGANGTWSTATTTYTAPAITGQITPAAVLATGGGTVVTLVRTAGREGWVVCRHASALFECPDPWPSRCMPCGVCCVLPGASRYLLQIGTNFGPVGTSAAGAVITMGVLGVPVSLCL